MSAVVPPIPAPLAELLASGGARAAYQPVVGDDRPDSERRFAHVLLEDRELVLDAARALMVRIAGTGG